MTPVGAAGLSVTERALNNQPALLVRRGDTAFAAIFIATEGGRIAKIFIQADPAKLARLG